MTRASERRRARRVHGHGLLPIQRLLRQPPPPEALAWATGALRPGARVVDVVALGGGTSSAVHALHAEDRSGRRCSFVLRRFVRSDWLAEEPDLAEREAAALEVARGCPIPTPELVAVDPHGEAAGVPAVLMTRLPGSTRGNPPDLEAFLRQLAAALPQLHATPLPSGVRLPSYRPYEPHIRHPPSWAAWPEHWQQAIELFEGPAPATEQAFIHRDFHPGNVLWARGRLQGVVDWVNASVGSPDADVGHCRVNLAARFGPPAADRFLALFLSAAGRTSYHPYWDVVAALGGREDAELASPQPDDEEFLSHALTAR